MKGGEKMYNSDIRNKAKKYGVCLWQIAEKLNLTDSTFSRKLRKELSQEEKQKIFGIIDSIVAER